MNRTFTVMICLAGLAIAGCAVPQNARNTAGVLALYTTQVKTDTASFAASRLELAKARSANIDSLEQSAVRIENDNALQLKVWQLANNDDAKLYAGLADAANLAAQQSAAFDDLRQKQADATASTQSAITVRSKQLDDTAKGLAALAEKPKWSDDVGFYFGFLAQVNAGITNLQANSAAQVKATTTNTATKTEATKRAP